MPMRPLRPCSKTGCRDLATANGRCPTHARPAIVVTIVARRETSTARGYGWRWRAYSQSFLRRHPLCLVCEQAGRVTAATVTDHITPHRGDMRVFWDKSNHQPLCTGCHSRKTATDDGGFGNRRRFGSVTPTEAQTQ